VAITVDQVDDDLVLAVVDDGTGGAVITDGAGLDGLRDRVEALDGTIDVRSAPQAGTTITVRLPLASPQ
jgi:signal transduction histidine kinase